MQRHIRTPDRCTNTVVTSARSQDALIEMTDIVGRKWHPVIIHHLYTSGPLGFSDLRDRIDEISPKMLSTSLTELDEKYALVERRVINEAPVRVEYALTAPGESLGPLVDSLRRWGIEHLQS